jgi:hypothetical protein
MLHGFTISPMKKIFTCLGIAFVGVCCIMAAYYCHFKYSLYQGTKTRWQSDLDGLDSRIQQMEWRMRRLEAHKVRNLKPFHLSCEISTTDQPAFGSLNPMPANTNGIFAARHGKCSSVEPEFRLPAGATNEFEFDIDIPEYFGSPVDAWLSHAGAYQDLAAFDVFHVYRAFRAGETNKVKLIAQVKTNSSVKMRFDIVVLCLSSDD